MSTWQGFDQRKICPKCRDYQTRVESKQRQSFSAPRVIFSLRRYIGLVIALIIARLLLYLRPLNIYLLELFFIGFVVLVVFFAYRRIYHGEGEKIDRQSRENSLIGYRLYCRNCGYTWEMTTEEWETSGRKERENFINIPSPSPSNQGNLNESFERIEWKPPDPGRGVFIVIGFVGLFLIVALLLYEIFWAKTHPDNPHAIVINMIGAIFALFIYTGLIVVFKPRANKFALLILFLVMIGLVLTALWFLFL